MTSAPTAVKVVVMADATLPRLAWEALLAPQPGLELWGTAAHLEDLLAFSLDGVQTAVLLDLKEPLLPQVEQVAKAMPRISQLCLVDEYDLSQIIALLQVGATGVLSRDATLPELTRALIAASRGEIVLPPELAAQALVALARGDLRSQPDIDTLTERERDVLTLLAQGMTNKDMAQTLFLSVRTVEAHLRNVYGKLAVASRTEAVLWAVQHGFEP
ncbi:MAG: response regulator transcription factor [Anaerolineaceae bacterium]|nr:response regulator transcription factor [Anaerolineaceae bacterium]